MERAKRFKGKDEAVKWNTVTGSQIIIDTENKVAGSAVRQEQASECCVNGYVPCGGSAKCLRPLVDGSSILAVPLNRS